jgi:hypothetical protein
MEKLFVTLATIDKIHQKHIEQINTLESLRYSLVHEAQKELAGEDYIGKIAFSQSEFKQFVRVYEQAVDDKDQKFTFRSREYLTPFAKYVIDYYKSKA